MAEYFTVDEDVEGSTPSRHPGPSQEGLF